MESTTLGEDEPLDDAAIINAENGKEYDNGAESKDTSDTAEVDESSKVEAGETNTNADQTDAANDNEVDANENE